ncbi:MAG TPA: hypothetical protein VHO06_23130 [Polyangia bacterium]|nr:hypothetical protein [Polyangia bacterium]
MTGPSGRSVTRQGFIILLLAFVLGFGIIPGGPHARGWMAAHVTTMLTAGFVILIGLTWERLRLSPRQRRILRFTAVGDGYWGVLAGVFATLFDVPGPVTGGGAHPAGWTAAVFFSAFIPVLTVFPFVFCGLVIYGLRGDDPSPV